MQYHSHAQVNAFLDVLLTYPLSGQLHPRHPSCSPSRLHEPGAFNRGANRLNLSAPRTFTLRPGRTRWQAPRISCVGGLAPQLSWPAGLSSGSSRASSAFSSESPRPDKKPTQAKRPRPASLRGPCEGSLATSDAGAGIPRGTSRAPSHPPVSSRLSPPNREPCSVSELDPAGRDVLRTPRCGPMIGERGDELGSCDHTGLRTLNAPPTHGDVLALSYLPLPSRSKIASPADRIARSSEHSWPVLQPSYLDRRSRPVSRSALRFMAK